MSNIPCIGSKISLISKSEIRYEGILYAIDMKESTVALAKVRSLGTEDRLTNKPLPPRDEVYEYIIFRASDIKDLYVPVAPELGGLPHDPAIVEVQNGVSSRPVSQLCQSMQYGHVPLQNLPQSNYGNLKSLLTPGHYSGERISSRSATPSQRKSLTTDAGVQVSVGNLDSVQDPRIEARNQMRQRTREIQMNYQNQRRMIPSNRRPDNRRGLQRRGRGRGGYLSTTDVLKFECEYDFEQANAEFQELESKLEKNKIDDSTQQDPQPSSDDIGFYDKSKSFFDDISCEATQRMKGFDWRIERKLNVETFGASANNSWLRRRRGRGGFRRGFRSRGSFTRSTENIPSFNRPTETTHQKTVTFDDTPAIKEVEVIEPEEKPDEFPVIELTVEKEKDWLEPEKTETIWN